VHETLLLSLDTLMKRFVFHATRKSRDILPPKRTKAS
jgi:hypothetical protein